MKDGTTAFLPQVGIGYEAFWLRDYAYTLEGSIDSYWATPLGWFVYTLDLVDPKLADQTVIDLVADFQKNGACEWVFGEKLKLPNYLASAALPLAGIRAMIERRKTQEYTREMNKRWQKTHFGTLTKPQPSFRVQPSNLYISNAIYLESL